MLTSGGAVQIHIWIERRAKNGGGRQGLVQPCPGLFQVEIRIEGFQNGFVELRVIERKPPTLGDFDLRGGRLEGDRNLDRWLSKVLELIGRAASNEEDRRRNDGCESIQHRMTAWLSDEGILGRTRIETPIISMLGEPGVDLSHEWPDLRLFSASTAKRVEQRHLT